jgi:hypothetical protein
MAEDSMTWAEVAGRLAAARNYWAGSTTGSGAPHAVHGVVEDLGPPAAVPPVVAALAAKYTSPQDQQYLPDHDPAFDVVYAVRPRSAMAWRLDDYAASQRRWTALS